MKLSESLLTTPIRREGTLAQNATNRKISHRFEPPFDEHTIGDTHYTLHLSSPGYGAGQTLWQIFAQTGDNPAKLFVRSTSESEGKRIWTDIKLNIVKH
jgi:hypothetical protein